MNYGMKFMVCLLLLLTVACSEMTQMKQEKSQVNTKQGLETTEDENKQQSDQIEAVETTQDLERIAPQYVLNENWYIKPIADANEKVVLLTIDDAPDKYALQMAKTLKKLNVGAIFFVNGHFLESKEEQAVLKEIDDMGFMIGNHTYSHAYLPDLSEDKQKEEVLLVNEMVEKITGKRPMFFRAPHGANTDFTKQLAEKEKMTLMNWSYGYDFMQEYMTKETITDIMIHTELLSNGANLLMHDREWTANALEDIVIGLQEKDMRYLILILFKHYLMKTSNLNVTHYIPLVKLNVLYYNSIVM
ncbi:polysaccharide deacetylase family protein [Paracerasibacillus soli]|uniref:Polysaccharide deacetylase family protein n=1 Tax=Paracerasibacillus soli TaxID=480284 RepID=A0ABU5CQG4_9BACI|nr:polysaccharide deacetylase family protein [Virgibacillus soli]MDY0408057.1 polysaccharide deacetylase family protein [Virgibacillus soli]